jgi:hypothetical protein
VDGGAFVTGNTYKTPHVSNEELMTVLNAATYRDWLKKEEKAVETEEEMLRLLEEVCADVKSMRNAYVDGQWVVDDFHQISTLSQKLENDLFQMRAQRLKLVKSRFSFNQVVYKYLGIA